jgi:hypothetical protein
LTEIFGVPSTGKTALIGQITAHNQRRENFCVAVLPSEVMDQDYFSNLGVSLDSLPVLGRKDISSFLRDFENSLLVIDSLTALVPRHKDRNQYIYDFCRDLLEQLGPGQSVVLTSHVRTRTSVDPHRIYSFGTQSASKRVTDLFVVRLELSREEVSPPEYVQVVRVVANILGPPAQFVRLKSKMGFGVDVLWDLVEVAQGVRVLERRGSHYYLDGNRIGSGTSQVITRLRGDKELETEIVRRVLDS